MKIISWNVNGLRAMYKKENWDEVFKKKPDILCIQETKAHPDQLLDEIKNYKNYFSYFSSSRIKKGYSGVALYSKIKPDKVEYGMGLKKFDQEGRLIIGYYKDFIIFNGYFPNGGSRPERLKYNKFNYLF